MIVIKNGIIITLDSSKPIIENGFVAIKNGKIEEVSSGDVPLKYKDYEVIDANGRVIMPGFINSHHHAYSAFARGASFAKPSKNFLEILDNLWWTLDRHLLLEDTKYSAYMTFIESVLNGVTTVIDHHASYGHIRGSLKTMADAAEDIGIRASLCYEVSDRDGKKKFQDSVLENVDFIKYTKEKKSKFLSGMFGLHASFTLSDESLKKCKEEESKLDSGFHVHCAEGISDVYDSLKRSGVRVIERFYNYGILGRKTLAVHCIHTNKREHELLKETGTTMVHAPESNMGNGVGCAPLIRLFNEKVPVGLGSDGYTSDMTESLKVAMCLQRHENSDPNVGWPHIQNALLETNRKIVKTQFNIETGILKKGAEADVIVLDYTPYTPLNDKTMLGHILFGLSGRMTSSVIIGGKIVLKEREFVNIDLKEIASKAMETSKKLWKRLS